MFKFIGRWLGRLSFSSILQDFDLDFTTQIKDGFLVAIIQVMIFNRLLVKEEFEVLNIRKTLTSVLDIDLVKKSDGEYLKVQFEIGNRVLIKELIKLSSVKSIDETSGNYKVWSLDDPPDVVQENQLNPSDVQRLIADIAIED